jgi:hypothetical protein
MRFSVPTNQRIVAVVDDIRPPPDLADRASTDHRRFAILSKGQSALPPADGTVGDWNPSGSFAAVSPISHFAKSGIL